MGQTLGTRGSPAGRAGEGAAAAGAAASEHRPCRKRHARTHAEGGPDAPALCP